MANEGAATTARYTCDTCGDTFESEAPLFTPYWHCRRQGCSGTAEPDWKIPPRGIERREEED